MREACIIWLTGSLPVSLLLGRAMWVLDSPDLAVATPTPGG